MLADWAPGLRPEPAPRRAYLLAFLGALVAAIATRFLPILGGTVVGRRVSLYLLPVLYVGGRWGIGPALAGAACAVVLHEILIVDADGNPVPTAAEAFELGVLLLVALVTGALAASARRAARRARDSELRATLLTSISHDLRTPLTTVKTTLATLRGGAPPPDEAVREKLLADAEGEVDRLSHLVANTLALARLRSGARAAREWNAIGELLFAALDRSASLLGDRPVAVDAPDTLPLVRVDAGLVDQAVTNLLENAALHTPAGTPVRVSAAVAGDELRVEVEDEGPGLPAADRERVLREFERATSGGRGVGLGLPIARAAAEAHGGRMWLDEGNGGGLRVVMLFQGVTSG